MKKAHIAVWVIIVFASSMLISPLVLAESNVTSEEHDEAFKLFGVALGMPLKNALETVGKKGQGDVTNTQCMDDYIRSSLSDSSTPKIENCMSQVEVDTTIHNYKVWFYEDFFSSNREIVVSAVRYTQNFRKTDLKLADQLPTVIADLTSKFGNPDSFERQTYMWNFETPRGPAHLVVTSVHESYSLTLKYAWEATKQYRKLRDEYKESQLPDILEPDF